MAREIVYCDRCTRMVRPGEIERGEAVVADSVSLCPSCAGELAPEERAALAGRSAAADARARAGRPPGGDRPSGRDAREAHDADDSPDAPASEAAPGRSLTGVFLLALAAGGLAAFAVTFLVVSLGRPPGSAAGEVPGGAALEKVARSRPDVRVPPAPEPPSAQPAPGIDAEDRAAAAAESEEPPAAEASTAPEEPPGALASPAAPAVAPPGPAPARPEKPGKPEEPEKPSPPPRVVPTFPPVMSPDKREAWSAYDRAFAQLADGDLGGASVTARGSRAVTGKALSSVLGRARKLREQAMDNLRKSPPDGPVRLTWRKKSMKGRLTRIDGSRAWIRMKNLEMPVDVSALPPEVFVSALGLDPADPESRADRAALLLGLGAVESGLTAAGRVTKEDWPELRELLEDRATLDRLKRFADGVAEIERLIKSIRPGEAAAALAGLRKDFSDLAAGEQKGRLDHLAARADAMSAVKRLGRALAGELVSADEDMTVELRYDFAGNPKGASDFTGSITGTDARGLAVKSIPHWERKPGQVNGLVCRLEFRPGTLSVEYLIQCARHDIMISNVGHSHVKIRWIDAGQILFTYEPVFSGDVFVGRPWKHPGMDGTYRYAFERTPEHVRFLLDGEERAKEPAPRPSPEEKVWTVHFEGNADFVVKEIVIRGRVDDEWLKARAPAE